MPSEDDQDRKRLLAETRADLLKRQLSNAENYDKAILSLSTACLGFSVVFLKDFVPIVTAKCPWTLYGSWIALIMAIVMTIFSYFSSQRAIEKQLKKAEDYYLKRLEDALARTASARITDCLNYASGVFFVLGIILTTLFVFLNIEGASIMSSDNKNRTVPVHDGAPVPKMQQVPFREGAPVPKMQEVPFTKVRQFRTFNRFHKRHWVPQLGSPIHHPLNRGTLPPVVGKKKP